MSEDEAKQLADRIYRWVTGAEAVRLRDRKEHREQAKRLIADKLMEIGRGART